MVDGFCAVRLRSGGIGQESGVEVMGGVDGQARKCGTWPGSTLPLPRDAKSMSRMPVGDVFTCDSVVRLAPAFQSPGSLITKFRHYLLGGERDGHVTNR